jgi:hypothetical protein
MMKLADALVDPELRDLALLMSPVRGEQRDKAIERIFHIAQLEMRERGATRLVKIGFLRALQ